MANKFNKKAPSSAKQVTKAKPKRKTSTRSAGSKTTTKKKNTVKRNALHRLGGTYAQEATQKKATKKASSKKKTTKAKPKAKAKVTSKTGQSKRVEKPPSGGNSTKKVPWGRTLSTKDRYLEGWNPSKEDKNRTVVVIDENNGELAVVRLSSEPKSLRGSKVKNKTILKEYSKKNNNPNIDTYYKHFIEIEDNEKKPIKINDKFRANHKNMDVSQKEVMDIRNTIFTKARAKQRNNDIYDKFKKK